MPQRLPSLSGLQAFESVARHASFTRAAEELGLSQTAVSHRISRLETQLGLRLFLRRGRQIALTEAAREYLTEVRDAFDALYRSTDRLLSRGDASRLTISSLISFAAKWLVPRIAEFQSGHPAVDVRILTSSIPVDFEREEIDLAIRYGSGDWPGLRADLLFHEDLTPICSPGFLGDSVRQLDPTDLPGYRLIEISTYPDDWHHWLESTVRADSALLEPDTLAFDLKFDLAFAAIEAAMDGAGIAMGRRSLIENDLAAGRLVAPFADRVPRRAYYLVAPQETADRPKIAGFRRWLLESLATDAQLDRP